MRDYKQYMEKLPEIKESDGCTLAPDGSWKKCCVLHDYARRDREVSNADADRMLLDCMRDESVFPLPWIYYFWVRFQGITNMSPAAVVAFVSLVTVVTLLALYG